MRGLMIEGAPYFSSSCAVLPRVGGGGGTVSLVPGPFLVPRPFQGVGYLWSRVPRLRVEYPWYQVLSGGRVFSGGEGSISEEG